ncbi:MAG: GNAT family N-acetyltransferase, partial [Pseudomonadota bacterium]
ERTAPSTIYQRFYWQRAWLETIGKSEHVHPLFVMGSRASGPTFLLALAVTQEAGLSVARFFGGSHANYKMGLFHADHNLPQSDITTLLKSVAERSTVPIDLFRLERMPCNWDGIPNPLCLPNSLHSTVEGSSAGLNDGFETLLKRGNAKRKRKILNRQERIFSVYPDYGFQTVLKPNEVIEKFATFLAHKNNWFHERGIKNPFEGQADQAFYQRLAQDNALCEGEESLLQINFVRANNEVIALLGAGVFNGQHFSYFTSINPDDDYKSASPGALNFYRSIEYAAESGLRRFDFGVGTERYKTHWCDEHHDLYDLNYAVSVKGRAAALGLVCTTNLKRLLKKNRRLADTSRKVSSLFGR